MSEQHDVNSEKKQPIIVTVRAIEKLYSIISEKRNAGENLIGIKIKLTSKGCGGNEYAMEYVEDVSKYDETVVLSASNGEQISVFLDPKTLFKMIGTVVDYEEDKLKSCFSFTNPREKGRCGCGKSFYY